MKKNVFVVFSIALLCMGGLALLSSCMKTNDKMPKPSGVISVLHADPNAPAMNVVFNSNNLGSIAYGQSGITQPTVGNYAISFVDPSSNDTLHQIVDSIGTQYYTLILYDTTSIGKLMFFQNRIDPPTSSQNVYVRFMQLSANAGAVNVVMDSSQIYTGRTFADNIADTSLSDFKQYPQGYHSFFVLKPSSNDTLAKLINLPLIAGNAYTIFLKGMANRVDSLGLQLGYMQDFKVFGQSSVY